MTDFACPTWYGPLRGVENAAQVAYRLPLPVFQHRALMGTPAVDDYREPLGELVSNSLQYYAGGHRWDQVARPIWQHSPTPPGNINLYTWMGAFPSTAMSLFLLDETTQQRVRQAFEARIRVPLLEYSNRIPIEERIEPYTGNRYPVISWLSPHPPATYNDHDEASACVLQALYYHALYTGDWEAVRVSWESVKTTAAFLESHNDWAYLASSCREKASYTCVDMLNATYPGLLCYAKMARMVGDETTAAKALYMAARAAVPTIARLRFTDYGIRYGLVQPGQDVTGFGENGPIAYYISDRWNVNEPQIMFIDNARGGVTPELINLYRQYAPAELAAWERKVAAKYPQWYKNAFGAYDLYVRAVLGMDSPASLRRYLADNLPACLERWRLDWPGLTMVHTAITALTADCPIWLDDSWAPARPLAMRYDPARKTATLSFDASRQERLIISAYCGRIPRRVTADGVAVPLNQERPEPGRWFYDAASRRLQVDLPAGRVVAVSVLL